MVDYWVSRPNIWIIVARSLLVTARQRSCGKVMFSVVSVFPVGEGGSHVTIARAALDLTVQARTPDMGPHRTGTPSPVPPDIGPHRSKHGTMTLKGLPQPYY